MALPLGELLDILAAAAVRSGRGKLKGAVDADRAADDFWTLMERR